MLKKVGVGAAVLAAAFAAAVATRPDGFRIERSTTVAAPPAVVQGFVADFHRWGQWSPFEKLDPDMKRNFDGPASGVGATYSWAGDKAGEGRMAIEAVVPDRAVRIHLEFFKPMAAVNPTTFTFEPSGAGTRVTWTMSGEHNLVSKALSVFVSMDQVLGKDFESGLAALKAAAEAEAARAPAVSR